ncbi:MAG: hypothetical protein HC918_09180 [Oscillatoriales cyanobacterium SM2_1_8]|nr:hypothetical protein [Oscillatoriales cyanobacterium SM2_1_8]
MNSTLPDFAWAVALRIAECFFPKPSLRPNRLLARAGCHPSHGISGRTYLWMHLSLGELLDAFGDVSHNAFGKEHTPHGTQPLGFSVGYYHPRDRHPGDTGFELILANPKQAAFLAKERSQK